MKLKEMSDVKIKYQRDTMKVKATWTDDGDSTISSFEGEIKNYINIVQYSM